MFGEEGDALREGQIKEILGYRPSLSQKGVGRRLTFVKARKIRSQYCEQGM